MGLENFLFLSGNGSVSVALLLVSVNLLDFTRGEVSSCPADLPRKKSHYQWRQIHFSSRLLVMETVPKKRLILRQ